MSIDTTDIISKMNNRFDNIEKLLQLMLVNNLLEDIGQIVKYVVENIPIEIDNMLKGYGLECGGFQIINNIEVIVIEIPKDISIKAKDINYICSAVNQYYPNTEPLFLFNNINGMQRKRLIQNSISFGVCGKELHVNNGGTRR